MKLRANRLLAILAAATLLTACGGDEAMMDEGAGAEVVEGSTDTSGSDDSASTQGVSEGSGFQGHPLDDPSSPLSQRTVYFEFDSNKVSAEDRSVIEAHAGWLQRHPGASITLEGHADERGTREYNIGLAERRVVSVRQLMALLGASGGQIKTISYGEERAAVEGHDESAWRFNRRVEIIYRSKE
jgi:peptidoglycan-associated lipoprotein